MGNPIPALTLHQPYGSLIAKRIKVHETREWDTEYRGPLAIHAGKKLATVDEVGDELAALCDRVFGSDWCKPGVLPAGAFVGIARLENIVSTTGRDFAQETTREDFIAGNFGPERFAWLLTHAREFQEPIPHRGYQKLWTWEAPSFDELRAQLAPLDITPTA